jgi:polysaccharide pyruvyl transferase WcaK-like protein
MSSSYSGRPPQRSLLHLQALYRSIFDLALRAIAYGISATVGRAASAPPRPLKDPLRILVEPSDYLLRNAGDMAMMQIAIERLATLWPKAIIQVLSDDPQRLNDLCPRALPLSSAGRQLWLADNFLPRCLEARTSPELRSFIRLQSPELVKFFWRYKLRHSPDRWHALAAFTTVVAEADAVIVTGMGGITDAFPEYAHDLLTTLSLALYYGKPVVLVGQGIGPLETPGLRELASHVLRRADLIALREDMTAGPLLKSLGVPMNKTITTGDDAIEIAYRARSAVLGTGFGINIRASDYSEIDLELMRRLRALFQQSLRTYNAVAVPVPISSVPGEADLETFRSLLDGYDGPSIEPPDLRSPTAIIEQLQNCRILVCGSYHAAVFACSSGIPTVCVAKSAYYFAKFRGLAELFGDGCEFVSLEDPQFEFRLRDAIHKCWTSAEQLRPRLLQSAVQQMALGSLAFQKIHDLISARTDRAPKG